jgi:MFS family permease
VTDSLFFVLLALIGGTFFGSPIWGYFARKLYIRLDRVPKQRLVLLQLTLILLAILIVKTSWSFRGLLADALVLSLAFFSFVGLAFIVSALKPKYLTWIVPVAAMVPTIAGMFLTVTLLGLMFIVGEYVPERAGTIDARHSYRITYYGNATTSWGGARVKVLYHPLLLPFVEKQVFDRELEFSEFKFTEVEVKAGQNAILVVCPKLEGEPKVFTLPSS